jgi:hypothetical protein
MSTFSKTLPKTLSKTCLLSLIAAASLAAGAANAGDRARTPQPRGAEVTGSIGANVAGAIEPSSMISRARAALDRFTQARGAMEHALLLRENPPKGDLAAVQSDIKDVDDNLAAIEQSDPSGLGASAKAARELADERARAGMQIMMPPATGLTEMPLPALVQSKAERVATALDRLVADATTNAVRNAAAAPSQPFAAVIPPAAAHAAPPMRATAHRRVAAAGPCGRVRVAHAKPMTQNEASARLFVEGLPLILPPAAIFIDDREHCQP